MDGGGDDTPDIKDESHVNVHNSTDNDAPSTDTLKPRGVCGMYAGLFLVSFSVMLNYFVSGTYQAYDTSTWQEHSLLSTINVVRGVIAAVALPVVAKLSDIIGRFECFILISIFFVLGNIIQAAASTIQAFAVGSLFSQIGYTRIQLVGEVIVADTTTLRTRLFFLFFSTFPNLITVSVSGNVTSSVLQATTWRWGYGIDRSVWAAIGIAFFGSVTYTAQSEFLYTVLYVCYDFSINAATHVGSDRAGIIAGQVFVGLASSLVTFPNIIIAMAVTKHEDVAVLTSLWLVMNWAGYAVGNCITGAIWTQLLYSELQKNLGGINAAAVDMVYAQPLYVVPEFPVGTPERTAIIDSYRYIEKLLVIATV
ncbi:ferrioxamine B transporter [Sporothrix curviconia]|uniref:Ferrioxamine B transporter n=1 Tax=Sporothrix curviconia TaxID=1260050 RepID=A0ABP0CRT1_9PEZI